MKKITLILICALAIFSSCNKENDEIIVQETQELENAFLSFDLHGTESQVVSFSSDLLQNDASLSLSMRGNNISAHGGFVVGETNPQSVNLAAMQNNGGIHGNVSLPGFLGGTSGETTCISVDGNQAVVGFIATEIGNPFAAELYLGMHMYLHVIDNGEGSNADPDQMFPTILVTDDFDCSDLCPSCIDWEVYFGSAVDISSGNIQVKD